MEDISFKTKLEIKCEGFPRFCSETVWVTGCINLLKVLTIPADLDLTYENGLYSAHTYDLEMPDNWFSYRDGWLCLNCYRLDRKDTEEKRLKLETQRIRRLKKKRLKTSR